MQNLGANYKPLLQPEKLRQNRLKKKIPPFRLKEGIPQVSRGVLTAIYCSRKEQSCLLYKVFFNHMKSEQLREFLQMCDELVKQFSLELPWWSSG